MKRLRVALILCCLGTSSSAAVLVDGDEDWRGHFALSQPVNGNVYTIIQFDSDLIIGGSFRIGGAPIVRWNGTEWEPMGTGFGSSSSVVHDAIVYDGDLVVTGNVGILHRWVDDHWEVFNGGFAGGSVGHVLLEQDGNLFIGGEFSGVNGVSASRVAFWDGAEWHPMGAGFNNEVSAMAMHDGVLYAGGSFSQSGTTPTEHIARWNGSSWEDVAGGMNNWVGALITYDSLLLAGGCSSSEPLGHFAAHRYGHVPHVGWPDDVLSRDRQA